MTPGQLDEACRQLEEASGQIEELSRQCDEYHRHEEPNRNAQKDHRNSQKDHRNARKDHRNARKDHRNAQKDRQQLAECRQQLAECRQQLDECRQQLDECRQQLDECRRKPLQAQEATRDTLANSAPSMCAPDAMLEPVVTSNGLGDEGEHTGASDQLTGDVPAVLPDCETESITTAAPSTATSEAAGSNATADTQPVESENSSVYDAIYNWFASYFGK